MSDYQQVFENNKQWVASKLNTDADFFKKMATTQHPKYLCIGCCDSRVPTNEIMGMDAGEVFVHRNIANLVCNADLSVMASINYAVLQLNVEHIVVCGHYSCGGVKKAMEAEDLGLLNPWLRNIRDVYRLHMDELNAIKDEHARYNRLVELNVEEQCINVIKTAAVQKSYLANKYPVVHGWVYDIKSGILKDLEIDFEGALHEIQKIYDLTGSGMMQKK
ncbi:carbonic anhydrase [Chitinophaga sp. MM2321]|uniref:carbonic anhydrase n=1 Tax=Chitinophaga sp. MM2321 TaxID=3137178 RepID=UPI0032D579E9